MNWKKYNNRIAQALLFPVILAAVVGFGYLYKIPKAQAACSPLSGWSYCNTIIIDHTKVSTTGGALINFPIEASSTIAQLATVGNGGHIQNTTTQTGSSYTGTVPADLQFSTSSTFSSLLPGWEFESYNSATGNIVAWLNVGNTLSSTTDDTIYMQYGNASVTTWQGNVNGTWNSGYLGVWHLPNGSTLNVNDSTSNVTNGTNASATASANNIDGTASVDGTGIHFTLPFPAMTSGVFTTSLWLYMKSNSNMYNSAFDDSARIWSGPSVNGSGVCSFGNSNRNICPNSPWTSGSWHYQVWIGNGAGYVTSCTDGVCGGLTATSYGSVSTVTLHFGDTPSGGQSDWNGYYDEIRLSNTAISAGWVSTEYNNQSAPDKANYSTAGFYTVGSEQGGGGGTTPPHAQVIDAKSQMIIKTQTIIN